MAGDERWDNAMCVTNRLSERNGWRNLSDDHLSVIFDDLIDAVNMPWDAVSIIFNPVGHIEFQFAADELSEKFVEAFYRWSKTTIIGLWFTVKPDLPCKKIGIYFKWQPTPWLFRLLPPRERYVTDLFLPVYKSWLAETKRDQYDSYVANVVRKAAELLDTIHVELNKSTRVINKFTDEHTGVTWWAVEFIFESDDADESRMYEWLRSIHGVILSTCQASEINSLTSVKTSQYAIRRPKENGNASYIFRMYIYITTSPDGRRGRSPNILSDSEIDINDVIAKTFFKEKPKAPCTFIDLNNQGIEEYDDQKTTCVRFNSAYRSLAEMVEQLPT